jgi:hypothetical protein
VPELRIVPQDLWEAVKARQADPDRRTSADQAASATPAPFWSKQRPRYLFSGLMRCGVCGGGFSRISRRILAALRRGTRARPPAATG